MKKFKDGDIIYNAIKTYPKVRFFANSGSLYYNNSKNPGTINDFLRIPEIQDQCLLLLENGGILLAENGNFIKQETCLSDQCFLSSENNNIILTENTNFIELESCPSDNF